MKMQKNLFCLFTWRDQGCWGRQVCCRFPAWWQEQCCSSLASSTNNQPTGDYQFLDKIHIWKCGRCIKHNFGLWSFVDENGPKNLFRCSPRVAVCRVYKVTTSLHKSAKCATISTILISLFRTKCQKLWQKWFSVYCIHISILAILLQNVKLGDIWIFVLGLFYNKVWLRGEECFL